MCSECGYAVQREHRLFRTRRRWRSFIAAVVAMSIGGAAVLWPKGWREGWASVVPTPLLITLMPDLQNYSRPAADELLRRMKDEDVPDWQCRWLVRRLHRPGVWYWTIKIDTLDQWPEGVPVCLLIDFAIQRPLITVFGGGTYRAKLVPFGKFNGATIDLRSTGTVKSELVTKYRTALTLPPGAHELEYLLLIERRLTRPAPDDPTQPQWKVLAIESIRIPIQVQRSANDSIDVDSSASLTQLLAESVIFELRNSFLHVESNRAVGNSNVLTCPVVIELLRNDSVVATWDDWWLTNDADWWFSLPNNLQGEQLPFGALNCADARWQVRARGNIGFALLNTGAVRCWGGEFIAPLHLNEAPEALSFQSRNDDK
jgi:hypothetical protein